ncbi:hypothetical protein ACFSHP_24990 [Novosphingobium panipatense]
MFEGLRRLLAHGGRQDREYLDGGGEDFILRGEDVALALVDRLFQRLTDKS